MIGREIAAQMKAQRGPQMQTRKEWCSGCGAFIGKHRDIKGISAPFELAAGMVPTGKRAFGPGKMNTVGRRRGGDPVVVNRPGPVTVACWCGTTNTVLHKVGTVV